MISPVFDVLNASTAVKALLGSKPLRVFPWGQAPQDTTKPYATYGVFNGNPENYLGNTPDIENQGTQIDICALTAKSCEDCFVAIRNALEPKGHMITYQLSIKDPETQLYMARMEFDLWQSR